MNELNIGNGIQFTVLDENLNPVTFKLAVFARKRWYGDKKYDLEFGYISENGKYAPSCYSGGNTGFGIDAYSMNQPIPEEYTLITTDIKEVTRIAKEEKANQIKAKEDFDKKQTEKAQRINDLPKEVEVDHPVLVDICKFERSEADYAASYSRQIKGGKYTLTFISQDRKIWLDDFVTKTGALQAKQFASQFPQFKNNPKEYLQALIDQSKELKSIVKNA